MISVPPVSSGKIHKHTNGNVISFRKLCFLFFMAMVWASSCKNSSEIQQESLYGKWDIIRAVRNGKETPYLRGGYFVIENTGSMTVNITGVDEKSPYTLEKNTLMVNPTKEFKIESIKADSMTIRYNKSPDSEFLFYLKKHGEDTR